MKKFYGETCFDHIPEGFRRYVFQALGLAHAMQTLILAGDNELHEQGM